MPQHAQTRMAGRAAQIGDKNAQPRETKGARTRRRIMDATAAMLAERPFNDVRITDIARAAEIVQPNFYTYFASLEAGDSGDRPGDF